MILDPLLDYFRGQAITIPPMDGALKPNTALEECEVLRDCAEPDNLAAAGEKIFYSSGNSIFTLGDGKLVASFEAPVTAVAAAADGTLAVALDNGRIELRGESPIRLSGFNCPVAMAFDGDGNLYVCNGSGDCRPGEWVSDLMRKSAKGSVWQVKLPSGGRQCLAGGLAFPYGVAVDAANCRLLVSESWRYRVISFPISGGAPTALLTELPGYPARIVAAPGGYVMALFAPRNRLIEFVLTEDDYRASMMGEIESRFWIAPSLSSSRSFLEPLQNGGVRTMGIHKPWSPSRSYGMVVELDAKLQPVASYHSRANGTRHGITSAIASEGAIIVCSKGGNVILRIVPAIGDIQ